MNLVFVILLAIFIFSTRWLNGDYFFINGALFMLLLIGFKYDLGFSYLFLMMILYYFMLSFLLTYPGSLSDFQYVKNKPIKQHKRELAIFFHGNLARKT